MFDPNYKGYPDRFPNIISKRKLTALPLFNQNQAPIGFSSANNTPTKVLEPLKGSLSAPRFVPAKLLHISTPKYIKEFKTINNYTRLCEQPFLEFSNFHFEQMLGSGSGKKRVVLDPIKKKQDKKKIQKMYTMEQSQLGSSIRIEEGTSTSKPRFMPQSSLDPQGMLESSGKVHVHSHVKVTDTIQEEEDAEGQNIETEPDATEDNINNTGNEGGSSSEVRNETPTIDMTTSQTISPNHAAQAQRAAKHENPLDVPLIKPFQLEAPVESKSRRPSQLELQNQTEDQLRRPSQLASPVENKSRRPSQQLEPQAENQARRPSRLEAAPAEGQGPRKSVSARESPVGANNGSPKITPRTADRPDSPTRIKKMYKIGDYEAIVGFTSLSVTLEQVDGDNQHLNTKLAKSQLKRIYKLAEGDIVKAVLEGLHLEDQKLRITLKDVANVLDSPKFVFMADEDYPEKRGDLKVELEGKEYKATVRFPFLDMTIHNLNYHEKLVLKPRYLSSLYEASFDNLQDFIERFTVPPQVFKTAEEIHEEELATLPPVIKKVIKQEDFGCIMLFKSMEISLKNTSEMKVEGTTVDGDAMSAKIMKRRKKDLNDVMVKVEIVQLKNILKCNAEEIVELIKESVMVEGSNFTLNFDPEKLNTYKHRLDAIESFPKITDKFMIRFNKFLYEAQIKFPTLEIYVPETNFKDTIQLTPAQLQELISNSFKNMESYIDKFEKPKIKVAPEIPSIALLIPPTAEDGQVNETAKLVSTVATKLGYSIKQGFMMKPDTPPGSTAELESNKLEKTKCSDEVLIKLLYNAKYAVFAWQTTANTTTNQSHTLKAFLAGLSSGVKEQLKDKKIFFVAETSEMTEGLEQDLGKQWIAGLEAVGVKLLKNLVIVRGEGAQESVEERLKELDQELVITKNLEEEDQE